MSTSNFERLARLFRQASQLDDARRMAYLDEACGSDLRLKSELISMLGHDAPAHDALRTGAMAELMGDLQDEAPEQLGPYRIVEKLGEGGMGVVYRAEQAAPMRRTVAIKLVKGFLAGRQSVARLEAERQALALMNHPNIAHVYDAGATPAGRPFFVMEWVAGEPITTHCEARGLGIPERLELLAQVCDGVQHAHRNSIIHRDIKPSNVIVSVADGYAVPKIIDFGVAKALDRRLDGLGTSTEAGQFLGTPEYMSPEQSGPWGGMVDTRTDVYSLGVLLYELLSGRRPFSLDAGGLEDLLRRIREETPERPSQHVSAQLARAIRGDLDWIALKALEKDPSRRYATPAELADDLARHIRNEPVLAGPPSFRYRLGKTVRRHRAASVLSIALVASLAAFAAIVAVQSARVSRAASRANKEAAAAAEMVDFALRLFGAPAGLSERSTVRFDKPLDLLTPDAMRAGLPGQPLLRTRLLYALGESYRSMLRDHEAYVLLEEAHETLVSLAGPRDPITLDAAESLGSLELRMRRFEASEKHLMEVYNGRLRLRGPDDPGTLHVMVVLGYMYKTQCRYEEAARWLEPAIVRLERVRGRDDREALVAGGYLAGVLLEQRRYAEAQARLLDLVARMPPILGDRDIETGIAMYNLGCAHANLGDRAGAVRYIAAAVERGFAPPYSVRQDPQVHPLRNDPEIVALDRKARFHDAIAWDGHLAKAELDIRQGRFAIAERMVLDVLDGMQRAYGGGTPRAYRANVLLADLYLRQGRFDDTEQIVLERFDKPESDPRVHESQSFVAWRYLVQCSLGRGEKVLALSRLEKMVKAEASLPWQGQEIAYDAAMRSAMHGDTAGALASLTLAADRGYNDADWLARDLSFRPLWGNPAFEAIVKRVTRESR